MPPTNSVKPRRLKTGDTIGVVAPASPFDKEKLEHGLGLLHEMGFATRLAPGLFERSGFLAGEDRWRAHQLVRMFLDDDIAAVICARGGYGSIRLLEMVEWEQIALHPKIFIGFSDITTLHAALFSRCGWVTFHGPTVTTLSIADGDTLAEFKRALLDSKPQNLTIGQGKALRPGVAQGKLIGGNLTTLNHLLGTPFAVGCERSILLIEDIGEAPYRVDRMLTQMRMAGMFAGLAGVVVGQFKDCGSEEEILHIIEDRFGDLGIPISTGWPIGHESRNMTIALGISVRLDADRGEMQFLEAATRG